MAIRFRFRSSLCFDSLDIDGRSSISVRDLKSKIVRTKNLNLCQDFDLVLCDANTGQEYSDENIQLPSGSSVIIKRVPLGSPHSDMVRAFPVDDVRIKGTPVVDNSAPNNIDSENFDDFGVDLCPVFGAAISSSDLDVDKKLYITNNESDKQVARFSETPMVGCEKPEASELSEAIPRGDGDDKDNSQVIPKPSVGELVKPKIVVTSNTMAIESIDLPAELKCTLCDSCFKEAVMIPCCQHSFCEKCIRLVLIEKGRCPKCLSTRCRVDNLLPNVSLRQAIERFLESRILMKNTDNAFGYAPDGESGIQVKELSCAASIQQREEELSHSPCNTGRGSNQITAKPIKANSSLPHQSEQVYGTKNTYHIDMETKAEDSFAEFQGENHPRQKEAESTLKRKVPWIPSADASRSVVEPGRHRKGDRTCYFCGSPDHFVRDCPAASNPYPMPQTGDAMFPGAVPGYVPPYWNQTPFPHMRPYYNPYGNPFNATMVPPTPFPVQPYLPSTFSSMAPFGGFAMMGGIASSAAPSAEWHHHLQGYEKRQKMSNDVSKRQQSFDDDEDVHIRKRHYSQSHSSGAKSPYDLKAHRNSYDDQSQLRNSSTEKPNHYGHFDDEHERSNSEVENAPCSSYWRNEAKQKHHHKSSHSKSHDSRRKRDHEIKRAVSETKREKYRHDSQKSSRTEHSNRKQRDGDSSHSYHESAGEENGKTKQAVSDAKREKRRKQTDLRESSHGSRHSRHKSSSMNDDPSQDRWQMVSGSDEDGEDHYYLKRKRHE